MTTFILNTLSFFVVIILLIGVHEFGHFWVARKSGVKVLCFSIGFGKTLWKWTGKQDGTEYIIAAIPLGGYVKMLDEREGPVEESERHRSFNQQTLMVRSAIVLAGPMFNLFFAAFLFWLVLVTGDMGIRPVVGEVTGSIAEEAGFVAGDEIVGVAGNKTETWEEVMFGLLAATGDGDIPVAVKEQDGGSRVRWLAEDNLLSYLEEPDPFGQMGIVRGPLLPPVLGQVVAGEAADVAGLRVGDRILQANGEEISSWNAFVKYVRARPDETLTLQIERQGVVFAQNVILGHRLVEQDKIGRIGAAVDVPEDFFENYRVVVRKGPLDAIGLAVGKTWNMSALMLEMMWRMVTGEASVEKNLGSVISIAKAAGQSAEYGIAPFIKFLAQISIVLGIMNLLPIPVLDGGHLMFFLIEAVRGKPLSLEVQEQVSRIGMALLMGLMGFALYLDLVRWLG